MGDSRMMRVGGVLRDVARGGLAGIGAGIVVGGLGGRLVMLVIAQLNRDAFGQLTEAEAVIGEFTLSGTLGLITFGGLGAGLVAGVLWVILSPWLPWTGGRRWLAAMPIALALGAFILVESTNLDFTLVGPTWLILVLLFALVALAGAATAWLDEALERRLPRVSPAVRWPLGLYAVIALLGVPALALTASAFLSEAYSRGPTPWGVGWALVVVGLATLILWSRRIAGVTAPPPSALISGARLALVAALGLGAWHIIQEVGRIFAAAS